MPNKNKLTSFPKISHKFPKKLILLIKSGIERDLKTISRFVTFI